MNHAILLFKFIEHLDTCSETKLMAGVGHGKWDIVMNAVMKLIICLTTPSPAAPWLINVYVVNHKGTNLLCE